MKAIWGKIIADWGWQKYHDITIIRTALTVKMPSQDTTKYATLKLTEMFLAWAAVLF